MQHDQRPRMPSTMRKIVPSKFLLPIVFLIFALATPPIALADSGSAGLDLIPPPPGANNWSCRPSSEHPRPVVLAHGTFENRLDNWIMVSPALAQAGYCVFALDYGKTVGGALSGIGPMAASAREISDFVDRVLSATGARQVDIVGHSQGGMLPRYYLKNLGGAAKVNALVGLAPDNHGTTWGVINLPITIAPPVTAAVCPSCVEQLATSEFIRQLNSGGEVLPGIKYTVVSSRTDEFATPYTTGFLTPGPDVTNILLQDVCPGDVTEHMLLTSDPVAIRLVRNALDPDHAVAPTCAAVQVGPAGI
ncbi:esterase/lipase family protein [Nocardia sp. NPDC051570]|uniref:esterase/lipase family protein n=1 Tax=Nocardia sp. NPDC051570 TaxID=3364324 RepID=UPI00378A2B16